MPRQKTTTQICKIRKRVSSSSSSSSAAKNYRFKRAILVGKRVGSSTPVPTWKVIMGSSKQRSPLAAPKLQNFEMIGGSSNNNHHHHSYKAKEGFSARKLAATLWEINGLHSSGETEDEFQDRRDKDRGRRSPAYEKVEGSKVGGQRRRSSSASQKLQITEYIADTTAAKSSSVEVLGETTTPTTNSSIKTRLKDVNNSLITSKELLKALFRILSQDTQHSSEITLVSALKVELDRARLQIDQLVQEHKHNSTQTDTLLRQLVEEKAAWRSKEKERVKEAVSSISRELEIERKLRRQAERLNKKLGVELSDSRACLAQVVKELEGEKRAKEILEQTCDELARGIGEERAKVSEELEKERKMLQLADLLREERVQMKLTDARHEYEEKNAALERLRTELEAYLKMNPSRVGTKDDENQQQNGDRNEDEEEESELHSIELSMDNNNKSFKWSFVCEGESRRPSVEEVFKGRRSLSEKIQWENICLHKTTSDGNGIEWEFTGNAKKQANGDGFEKGIIGLSCEGSGSENSPVSSTAKSSSSLREACTAILKDLASRRDGVLTK